jgi:hypothetical protein
MKTKTTIITLAVICGVLAVLFFGQIFFSGGRSSARKASYTWLDAKLAQTADGIRIYSGDTGETFTIKKNMDGAWIVDGSNYPVKVQRVDDLISELSRKAAYPVFAEKKSSHEKLGLAESAASRLTIKDGERILLDLLLGGSSATGRDIYLRKASLDEVRSGRDNISQYIEGGIKAWSELHIFGEQTGNALTVADIQRAAFVPPPPKLAAVDSGAAEDASQAALPPEPKLPLTITRSGEGWLAEDGTQLDSTKVESYLRGVIETTGEEFVGGNLTGGYGSVRIETGTGEVYTLTLGAAAENGTNAALQSSPFVYRLSQWSVDRLFKQAAELQ